LTARLAAIFGCSGPELTPDEAAFFARVRPWGFILFARNVVAADQIRTLTGALRETVGHDAPVLIDQEGGRVARLRPPLGRDWPPPRDHAAEGDAAIRDRYAAIGRELRDLGIDVNCVPCADVARAETHPFLANRCLGDDPARVARLARAAADGCLAGGVLPVVKHIPGHGAARADSHATAPVVDAPLDELRRIDFAPFTALADLPLGMTAHVVYPALDPDNVATLSPAAIGAIRGEIGFDGLLMTDDICMGALGGTLADRSRAALAAGCDVILHCNGDLSEMVIVAQAAGAMPDAAMARAERALAARPEVTDACA
jgi:beta-N-acetylhexosaminidase